LIVEYNLIAIRGWQLFSFFCGGLLRQRFHLIV